MTLLATGAVLHGRFRLIDPLGAGGVATVWRAFDAESNRDVALKILHPHLRGDQMVCERFRRELGICQAVRHPAIVEGFQLFEDEQTLAFAMELLEGTTLKSAILTRSPLSIAEVLEIARQCLRGLAAAHAAGVIHRDLKSQNILLCANGAVKILDFGFARVASAAGLTTKSLVLCTPDYAAPEVVGGQATDPRADLYALGVVLYEALCGRLPYRGRTPFELLRQHLEASPRPVRELRQETPVGLESIVQRLMQKAPEDRFPSAEAVLEALKAPLEPEAPLDSVPRAVCSACGESRQSNSSICPACGVSDDGQPAGDWMVVLTRAPAGTTAELAGIVRSAGAIPGPLLASGSVRAITGLPRVIIKGVSGTLAHLVRERCQARNLQVELRRFPEKNADLLHKGNTPGYLFNFGMLLCWAAMIGLGWIAFKHSPLSDSDWGWLIPGVPALAGPLFFTMLLRHTHWFLPALAHVRRAGNALSLPPSLAQRYREALKTVKAPSLRGTLRRLFDRALVIHGAGQHAPPHVQLLLEGPRRSALELAQRGIELAVAAQRSLEGLALVDEGQLWNDWEASRASALLGSETVLAAKQQVLEQLDVLERNHTLTMHRLLQLASVLEVAAVHALVAAAPTATGVSTALRQLTFEAQAASETARDIAADEAGSPLVQVPSRISS